MKTPGFRRFCLCLAAGSIFSLSAAELSKTGMVSLRQAMQSDDYRDSLGKQHKLSPDEIRSLMPAPGVIRPNAVTGTSSRLVNAKKDLMKDLLSSSFRDQIRWRVIAPPGFNPGDFGGNNDTLGNIPPIINALEAGRLRKDYWVSRCRPMLPLDRSYDQVKTMFTPAPGASAPGMPASLVTSLSQGWASLSGLLKAVVRLEPLTQGQFATGIYLGDGKILTAKHVYVLMTPETKAVWPGLPDAPRCTINRADTLLDVMDLAIVFTEAPPADAMSAKTRIAMATPGSLDQNQSIAVLNCPQEYGRINGNNFQRLYGDPRIARASPGIIRKTAAPNSTFVQHDCATMQGSSGAAVVSLPSGNIIGIHVAGDDLALNQFIPLSASTLFSVPLP